MLNRLFNKKKALAVPALFLIGKPSMFEALFTDQFRLRLF